MLIIYVIEGRTLARLVFKPVEQIVIPIALSRREECDPDGLTTYVTQGQTLVRIPFKPIDRRVILMEKTHILDVLRTYVTDGQILVRVVFEPIDRKLIPTVLSRKRLPCRCVDKVRR